MAEGKCYSFSETQIDNAPSRLCCIFCKAKMELRNIVQKHDETQNYFNMISDCFNIEIHKDSRNFKICEICIKRLLDSCKFKSSIEYANKLLIESCRLYSKSIHVIETKTSLIKEEIMENLVHSDISDYECDKDTTQTLSNCDLKIEKDIFKTADNIDESQINSKVKITSPNATLRFSCKMCAKTYRNTDALKQHVRNSHKGIKPFVCRMCSIRFSSSSQKNKHMFEVHDWKSRVYPCVTCGKVVYNASVLRAHIQVHHNDIKNYTCSVCNRRFFVKSQLKSHEISHSEEKNFSCNVCGKSYTRKATLTKHLKIHANIRDFECEFCGKTFVHNWNLKSHLKTHIRKKS